MLRNTLEFCLGTDKIMVSQVVMLRSHLVSRCPVARHLLLPILESAWCHRKSPQLPHRSLHLPLLRPPKQPLLVPLPKPRMRQVFLNASRPLLGCH